MWKDSTLTNSQDLVHFTAQFTFDKTKQFVTPKIVLIKNKDFLKNNLISTTLKFEKNNINIYNLRD